MNTTIVHLWLISIMFTIIFGVYIITQINVEVGCIVLGVGIISIIGMGYEMVKPSGQTCPRCNGTGELPRPTCSECGSVKH